MKHLKSYKIFESGSDNRISKEKSFKMVKGAFSMIEKDLTKLMKPRNIEPKKIFSKTFGGSGEDNEWFSFDDLDDTQMVDYMVEEDTDVEELRLSFKMVVECDSIIDVRELNLEIEGKYELTEISEFVDNYNNFSIRPEDPTKRLIEFFIEYDMYHIIRTLDKTFKNINEEFTDNFREGTNLVKVLSGLLDKIRRDKGLWREFMTNIKMEVFEDGNMEFEEYYNNFHKMGNYWYVDTTFTRKPQYVLNELSKSTIKYLINYIMEDEDVTEYINKDLFKNINESFTSRFRTNGYSVSPSNDKILRKMLISILDRLFSFNRELYDDLMDSLSNNFQIGSGYVKGIFKNFKKEWYLSYEGEEYGEDGESVYTDEETTFEELPISYVCDIIDHLMKDGRITELVNKDLFRSINND